MPPILEKNALIALKNLIKDKYKKDKDIETLIEQIQVGLVWEENENENENIQDYKINEIKEKRIIKNDKDFNLLIEGDNLPILHFLKKDYTEKIDIIYIDPPYNTGTSSLSYNDRRNDKNKVYLHSEWISFIKKRLLQAKILMAKNSVIFISIDDSQQAHLKLLCDEIFGEDNFLSIFIRKTKTMTSDNKNGLNIQHEYLLVYAKNKINFMFQGNEKSFEKFSNSDADPNGLWCSSDPSAKSGGKNTYFPIVNPITGQIDYPPKGRYWAFSKETMEKYIISGRIKFKEKIIKNQRGFIFKRYANNMKNKYLPFNSLEFIENSYLNSVATKELNLLIPNVNFTYPKPVEFIKKIIKSVPKKNSIILDFFAGSGTTAQAILELNEEDNGNRKFILCTNNENNICEKITYERIKKTIENLDKKEDIILNLKYLKLENKESK